jgi:hypothetical protein
VAAIRQAATAESAADQRGKRRAIALVEGYKSKQRSADVPSSENSGF